MNGRSAREESWRPACDPFETSRSSKIPPSVNQVSVSGKALELFFSRREDRRSDEKKTFVFQLFGREKGFAAFDFEFPSGKARLHGCGKYSRDPSTRAYALLPIKQNPARWGPRPRSGWQLKKSAQICVHLRRKIVFRFLRVAAQGVVPQVVSNCDNSAIVGHNCPGIPECRASITAVLRYPVVSTQRW
jgi:hypothetical protein